MDYFNRFSSNTAAAGGNQTTFSTRGRICRGRVYERITAGGRYRYSLLFSNILDSTFEDGSQTRADRVLESWDLLGIRAGRVPEASLEPCLQAIARDPEELLHPTEPDRWTELTVDGKSGITVLPGAFFSTDPVELEFDAGDCICLELTFRGNEIPCHRESILPVFREAGTGWRCSPELPLPGMIGCDRKVCRKVGFFGDSITQGCWTRAGRYEHWSALAGDLLGTRDSFWNLGIGYGRASDAAGCGAWMFKAKHCTDAVVCFGVNDILQGRSARQIIRDLDSIVGVLHASGVRVLIQAVPPFDYDPAQREIWETVNDWIRRELAMKTEGYFDPVPVMGLPDAPHMARYGGHPVGDGGRVWAEAIMPSLEQFLNACQPEERRSQND